MARRRRATKRIKARDEKFSSELVSRFINCLMLQGKKSIAESAVYAAMEILKEKTGSKDSLEALKKAIDNVKPVLEVRSRRVGGATYQVPVDVSPDRRTALAFRWIVGFARSKKGGPISQRLAGELLDAFNNTGSSVKKKEDTHKMAEANKAFAHYKW
ncbi:MAG: 30S ribosomal protein S7 [bacterium]|nr:30S ribosomal protein S7 [Candidatus Auribacterota bacterium]MDD5645422.1 30S ribosomal protein S7 [bacterium]